MLVNTKAKIGVFSIALGAYLPECKNPQASKAPDFDTYRLLRATHSHVSAPLRSVLDMCNWHIAPYPIFAYRGIIIPLLCSYRGGSQGLSPTYEQAHVGLDLLTLVSSEYVI